MNYLLLLLFLSADGCGASEPQPQPSPSPSASFGPIPTPSPAPSEVTVTLSWNPPAGGGQVTQYNIYESLVSGAENLNGTPFCTSPVPITTCAAQMETYTDVFFVATSVNASFNPPIQSVPSGEIEVIYPIPSPSPSNVQVEGGLTVKFSDPN